MLGTLRLVTWTKGVLKMLDRTTLTGIPNAISSPELASGHLPCEMQDGPMAAMFGRALAPVNLSARQAKALGLMTSGIYGQRGSISLASANLMSFLVNKLQAATASIGSTLYTLTWKPRVTPGGALDLCAAGVGAPHIRQRLWFVADTYDTRLQGWLRRGPDSQRENQHGQFGCDSAIGGVADATGGFNKPSGSRSNFGTVAGSNGTVQTKFGIPEALNSQWSDADWLLCRDGKWRPVESGTFPLAYGASARVGRLRAYGNAINAKAAEAVIRAYMECRP